MLSSKESVPTEPEAQPEEVDHLPPLPAGETPLVEAEGLTVHFPVRGGLWRRVRGYVRAVDGVSFRIRQGTTVGLVGESGSGKTTTGHCLVKLLHPNSGSIRYNGSEIGSLSKRAFFPYRKRIQMIFQDPFNSLNPRMSLQKILSEPLEIHFPDMSARRRRERAAELLEMVGLEADHLPRYPHEFSGGQRQRIGIARALAGPCFLRRAAKGRIDMSRLPSRRDPR